MQTMKIIRGLHRWTETTPCVVTIGNFDGVHLGHQAMLQQLSKTAQSKNHPICVISFEPLPHEYFGGDTAPARLNGFRDRMQNMAAQGVDLFLVLDFNERQASQTAEDFIETVLIKTLQAKHILVGDDFRFGHKRAGDFSLLQSYEQKGHFSLERYDTVSSSNDRVSSTRIREHLQANELGDAAALLGHRYAISGRVVHGEKVGRQLGFPTANVALGKHVPPLKGVFAVLAHDVDTGKSYAAVANLGERPTVGGRRLLLEVHLLDTDADLYGHHMRVEFVEFIRGEEKFDSLDALKAAIADNAKTASNILNGNPEFTSLSNRIH